MQQRCLPCVWGTVAKTLIVFVDLFHNDFCRGGAGWKANHIEKINLLARRRFIWLPEAHKQATWAARQLAMKRTGSAPRTTMRAMQRGKLAYARSRQTMRACICRGERAQVGRDHGMQPIDLALARTLAEVTCLRASAAGLPTSSCFTR